MGILEGFMQKRLKIFGTRNYECRKCTQFTTSLASMDVHHLLAVAFQSASFHHCPFKTRLLSLKSGIASMQNQNFILNDDSR